MQNILDFFNKRNSVKYFVDGLYLFWGVRYVYEFWLFIQKPITELIGFVPDDTFYYLKIVENAHNLQFISFDGINITSGFHYLHFCFLYVLYFLHPTKEAFVLYACLLSAIAFAGAITIVWLMLRKRGYYFSGVMFFLAVLLSDFEKVAFMGLEVGLAAFMFALVLHKFENTLHAIEVNDYLSLPSFSSIFLLVFVAFLSRSDFILILFVFSAIYWLFTIRNKAINSYRWGIATLLAFFLHGCITYALSHHFTQDSGAVKLALRGIWRTFGVETWSLSLFSDLHMVLLYNIEIAQRVSLIAIIGFLLVTFALVVQKRLSKRLENVMTSNVILSISLFLVFLLIGVVYQWVFAQVQIWYMLVPSLALILSISFGLESLVARYFQHIYWKAFGILVALCCCVFSLYFLGPSGAMYPWQADMYRKSFELKELYGKEISGRIGIWNAGIIGYFSDLPIVNLDGLVNGTVRNIIVRTEKGSLVSEIKRERIDYLADWDGVFNSSVLSFYLGDQFIKNDLVKIGTVDEKVPFSIYKVR